MGGTEAHTAGGVHQPCSEIWVLKPTSHQPRLHRPLPLRRLPGEYPASIRNILGHILPQYRREDLELTPRIKLPFLCSPNFHRTAIHVIGGQFLTQGAFTLCSHLGRKCHSRPAIACVPSTVPN